MADYKLWNALKDAKKYRWVELSQSVCRKFVWEQRIRPGSGQPVDEMADLSLKE